jgi:2-methylaconitate cis-trans-isomerase PrpF
MDGMGGSLSTNSKVAIIDRSPDPDYDVVYNFGQVSIDRPMIDYKGNCGNISAAVGPFAIDEGLVNVVEPITKVRIYQKNTKKLITAEVPVKDGRHDEAGDYAIHGVPGTGAKITLRFSDPGGAVTGKLFPTGNPMDSLEVPAVGKLNLTIIDAGNPWVLVPAQEIGLIGTEVEEIDLVARVMSMGTLHKALAVSCAITAAGAAAVDGTIVRQLIYSPDAKQDNFRLGHPSGIFEVGAKVRKDGEDYQYIAACFGRTARRLMEGHILVPERHFS